MRAVTVRLSRAVARLSQGVVRPSRREDGFTLIELLVAIVITGVITLPLGDVVIGYLKVSDATTGRLIESHDVQIAAAYWSLDVASIGVRSTTSPYALGQSVETGVASQSGLYPCGPAGTPSAIVRLAWDSSTGPGMPTTVVRVAYVIKTVSGQRELHRLRCEGSATLVSDVTIAYDVDPSTLPALQCSTTCTAVAVPRTVTFILSIKDPKNIDGAYVARLTGQRRQS